MERENVKKLEELSVELGIPQTLLRVIVAYSIVYTKKYDMFTPQEIVYELSKESLNRVDVKYVNTISRNDNRMRIYGRELVEEVAKEMGIVDTKKNNL